MSAGVWRIQKEMTSIEGTGKENIYFFQDLVETRALYLQKLRDVLYRES